MEIQIDELLELLSFTSAGDKVKLLNSIEPLRKQGIDSLDMMDFFLEIEEKYDFHIPDEDVEELKSLDNIKAYLEDKLK